MRARAQRFKRLGREDRRSGARGREESAAVGAGGQAQRLGRWAGGKAQRRSAGAGGQAQRVGREDRRLAGGLQAWRGLLV